MGIICIAVFVINGQVISEKNRSIYSLIEKNNTLENELALFSFNDSVRTAVESNTSISGDIILETTKESSIYLSEIINENIVILKYSEISCNQCVENELFLLKNLIDLIGVENIIIIADYDDISQLFRFQRINNIEDVRIFISRNEDLNLFLEEPTTPYYFILDNSLRIKSFYMPDKEFSQMTLRYYRIISRHFFAGIP